MRKRITAFGEVMMRLQVPGYETLAQADTLRYTFSGTGVNIATALSRFGHDGYLITTLPEHPLGEAAIAYLRKLGIRTDHILRGGRHIGMYFLENGFGPRPSRVTYTDRLGSSFNTAGEDTYDFRSAVADMDFVHLCGISLAMNDTVRGHVKTLAQEAKRAGATVVFDCNYRPSLWGAEGHSSARRHYEDMLATCDVAIMNEKDARLTLGMATDETDPDAQLQELIPKAANQYGIRVIAGTRRSVGSDGTHTLRGYLYKDGRFAFSKAFTFPVYDRIGAGDAFAAGVIHGEAEGFSAERTVAFAAASAMLAHTTAGDSPIATVPEVFRALDDQGLDVER